MYYNYLLKKFIFDAFDYYLLSALIVSYLMPRFNQHFSERAKMERLKTDLISQSRLIEPSTSKPGLFPKTNQIRTVYKVTLDTRGGQLEYRLASKIQTIITGLFALLQDKKNRKLLNFILSGARFVLTLILSMHGIDLQYVMIDPVSKQVIIIAMASGGATGYVLSWIAAGTTITVTPILLSILTLRSSFQQITHNRECAKLKAEIDRMIQDQDLQHQLMKLFRESQKQTNGSLENFEATNHLMRDGLNWNTNPEIREAVERLGIVEPEPIAKPIDLEKYPEPKKRLYRIYLEVLLRGENEPNKGL